MVVVGGGVHAATLLDVLAHDLELSELEIRLVATDRARLEVIATHVAARLATARPGWTLRWGVDLDGALAGADVVTLLVRVGGGVARRHDETFPARCGLVGDEGLGPGGIANAWRTVPVIASIAASVRSLAPDALVVNMVAPLGVTTSVVSDAGVQVVGVCELPTLTWERLERFVAPADRPSLRASTSFGGLNHLSWFWPVDDDAAPRLRAAALEAGLVDELTWQEYGGVPMPYFYRVVEPGRGRRLGIVQPPGRAEQLGELSAEALAAMRRHPGDRIEALQARPTPWFERALVPVVRAWLGLGAHRGPLDGRAPGQLGVVESCGEVDHAMVRLQPLPSTPRAIADFTRSWQAVDAATLQASLRRSPDGVHAAIERLPLTFDPGCRDELARGVLSGASAERGVP